MRKRSVAVVAGVVAAAFAGPGAGVAAADFVCPVLPGSQQGKLQSSGPFITIPDGDGDGVDDTSILPGKAGDSASSPVDVPDRATNGDGTGSPMTPDHSAPGDTDYTGIWNTP
jgi:hypothetical protein